MPTIAELKSARATHLDAMSAVVALAKPSEAEVKRYDDAMAAVVDIDAQIKRAEDHQALMAKAAQPVGDTGAPRVPAAVKTDAYERDPSIAVGGMLKMFAMAKGNHHHAVEYAQSLYGEDHPVTRGMLQAKALATVTGTAGGFVVPPDFVETIIPLLYAQAVLRKAGAVVMPMPSGTMTIPKMTGGSAAYWIGETRPIPESQPTFGQIVATAKKLAALVPVSNDWMRYALPQTDALLRNDIVKQIALAEDAAGIRSPGTQFSPRGLKSFAQAFGQQLLSSTSAFTLATVNGELAGCVNKLESANVAMLKPGWLMSPRTKNYLLNVMNTNGFYVYKDEMTKGTLLTYPYYTTTQIPTNLVNGGNTDCSEIYFVDFNEVMILESRQMEFAISTEGSYVDGNGVQQNAFQNDLTLIRAIMAEDIQVRHDEAVVLNQNVRWAPAIQ